MNLKMSALAAVFAVMTAMPAAYAEEPVMDVDFRQGTPVMAAIYALAQKSGHEVVFDDRIPGTFSMSLKDVTFGDAVRAIAGEQNLLCEERDGVMHVALRKKPGTPSMLERVSRQRARHNALEREMQEERRAEEERQAAAEDKRRRPEKVAKQEDTARARGEIEETGKTKDVFAGDVADAVVRMRERDNRRRIQELFADQAEGEERQDVGISPTENSGRDSIVTDSMQAHFTRRTLVREDDDLYDLRRGIEQYAKNMYR